MPKPPLVMIEWVDSASYNGWAELSRHENRPIVIRTVGWLIRSDKSAKTVVASLGETIGNGDMTIPAGCIKRVRRLKDPRE